ncbi:MAG TPA: tRNA (guanosine(37)-N1)-methyltransferase TrmD [Candidatus Pacearchaeota archaeon]|nr:tRNA (guanosine(37)-N1)-methyltransferase TrmD [Candidatus Pacearchaeota archaeon]HOK94238.1 tRNA (guanosine(37)-N1)-methyltransferase TrmD [Candidatus Pacearchaeota archaeon]HPO75352.1 tRNA (guanosine(37)-N1)-methyltransferase TrmD [Candidatus Pacearchaeota archaeon]
MVFHIITIFPHVFDSYFNEGVLKRAQDKGLIEIKIHDLRDFTTDKRRTVDDRPFGGGPGMVLKIEPIYKAINSIIQIKDKKKKTKIILLSAKGKKFNQKMADRFSKLDEIILICGRYEGVDERVAEYISDMEISIGDYILSGGELPAMIIIETVSRLIPGVLGNAESIEEKRNLISNIDNLKSKRISGYPVYTRPAIFKPKPGVEWKVPEVLLSGNHKEIEEWRKQRLKRHT